MLEYVLDTETSGLSPKSERICEVGIVEVRSLLPTGRTLHRYCNIEKRMPREAERVHGLSDSFLADKPKFAAIADELLAFIGEGRIVAHNARFDISFLNAELERMGRPALANEVVDTLDLSREVRKGKNHSLDAICRDYGISLAKRTKHGALLDAQILAEAYIELRGGRQQALFGSDAQAQDTDIAVASQATGRPPRPFRWRISAGEYLDHMAFRSGIKDAIWSEYNDVLA